VDAHEQEDSMKKIAALVAVAAAVGLAPRHASAQSLVTCESRNSDRQICRVDTGGSVAIRQQLSSTNCIEGRNWGYSRNAIWVSNGCRAQFLVNANQYNNGYNNNGRYNNGGYDSRRNGSVNNRSYANAQALCRRAVMARMNRQAEVSTWMVNDTRSTLQVGWRLRNGRSGECAVDRAGNVTIQANRGR
jgi:hypothetical protein